MGNFQKENHDKHPRSNQARYTIVPRPQEDYDKPVSEEIEVRVTKKLSKEFSKTENRISAALSRPDEFFLNPLIQGHSGCAPETSRSRYGKNQGMNEDCSPSCPHPETRVFQSQSTPDFSPDDAYDIYI